jgi:co-chaperonin GroES (HSP10)
MATPKSAKLIREEGSQRDSTPSALITSTKPDLDGSIKIREIPCLNDFVAILLFRVKSDIQLPDAQQYRNEGIVVGVGPGLPDGNGGRVSTQLKIGDVVLFQDRHIVIDVNSDKPPYRGQRIIIISERSLICKLPPVEFEVIN